MNGTQMADERTKITKQRIIQLQTNNYHSEYDIPDNFAETNQEDWIGAYVTSAQQVYLELDRIAVVKRIDSDETIHTTKFCIVTRTYYTSGLVCVRFVWTKVFAHISSFANTTVIKRKFQNLFVLKLYREP